MKKLILGAIAIAAIVPMYSSTASALENTKFKTPLEALQQPLARPFEILQEKPKPTTSPEPPKPKEYTVLDGDTLTKIAAAEQTTIELLWRRNEKLGNPDQIRPGDVLIVPRPGESLPDRPYPGNALAAALGGAIQPPNVGPRGIIPGNDYAPGYCTWYVKNRRPDIPNNLGNADTWVARAAAQGYATGSVPRAGAVGQTSGMHVVYVEAVNPDGSIQIAAMNELGLFVENRRTTSASEFTYIY